MKAIGFTEFGGPEVLRVLDLPKPSAGPGQIRVRVHAAAVNPSDTLARTGEAKRLVLANNPGATWPPPPYVAGWDAAGVVDEIGPETTTDLAVGDRVVAVTLPMGTTGAYAEWLVVSAESVVRAPAGMDHVQASTLPLNGLTATLCLDRLALDPGSILAITGAGGTMGGYAVQLAKARGLRVIADASEADEDLVKENGADVVVRRGPEIAARIREVFPEGVDGVIDGAVQSEAVAGAVRDGGAIATLRFYSGDPERGIRWLPVSVSGYVREHAKLDHLRGLAETGGLTLRVADTYPAEQAADAHRRLETGTVRAGRLVLTF